jgi:amylosucrase
VHRPEADWDRFAERHDESTVPGQVYTRLRHLIEVRKEHEALAGVEAEIVQTGSPHVLGYVRQHAGERILILASFTEEEQRIPANTLRIHGLSYRFTDLVTGRDVTAGEDLILEPLRFVWLKAV